jgi:hypothetical protein
VHTVLTCVECDVACFWLACAVIGLRIITVGVTDTVKALKARDMWEHTLTVFTTDNGGPVGSLNGRWSARPHVTQSFESHTLININSRVPC